VPVLHRWLYFASASQTFDPALGALRMQPLDGGTDLAAGRFGETAEFLGRQHDATSRPCRCTRTGSDCAMSINSPKRFFASVAAMVFMRGILAKLAKLGKECA
jgi:hypothetical protein